MTEIRIPGRPMTVGRCIPVSKEMQKMLVVRRFGAAYNDRLWEFAGGQVEEGEVVEDAIRREVLEEAGLIIGEINGLSLIQERIIEDGKYAGSPYTLLGGVALITGGKIELSSEHDDYHWESVISIGQRQDLTTESQIMWELLASRVRNNSIA